MGSKAGIRSDQSDSVGRRPRVLPTASEVAAQADVPSFAVDADLAKRFAMQEIAISRD